MSVRDLIPWGRPSSPPAVTQGGDVHPFVTLHREMNRLFDDFVRGFDVPVPGFGLSPGWPQMDIVETDREYRVVAEIPGLEEKDIDVTLNGDVLTLRGEKKIERDERDRSYSELFHGRFSRMVQLGPDIDPDHVEARYRNGVLTVVVPKRPDAGGKVRRVPINAH